MTKLITVILLVFSISSNASSELIKIFNNNGEIQVGLNLTCPFDGLSQIVTPNSILTTNTNSFEIILSLPYQNSTIICSPLPPEFIDPLREYFSLGQLEPGDYSINVKYVENDGIIPAGVGVVVYDFSQLNFQIDRPITIPTLNWLGILLIILFMVVIAGFAIIKLHMPSNN